MGGRNRGKPEHNPLLGIKPPPPLPARTRYLSPDEIKALWLATEEESWPFQQIYRLFLLTGQRREEVAGMRWEELDLKNALWNLPAIGEVKVTKKRKEQEYQTGRTKNREAHIVNLSRQALAVIDTIPRAEGGFCFSTTGYSSPSGFGKVKARIDARIASLIRESTHPLGQSRSTPHHRHALRRFARGRSRHYRTHPQSQIDHPKRAEGRFSDDRNVSTFGRKLFRRGATTSRTLSNTRMSEVRWRGRSGDQPRYFLSFSDRPCDSCQRERDILRTEKQLRHVF